MPMAKVYIKHFLYQINAWRKIKHSSNTYFAQVFCQLMNYHGNFCLSLLSVDIFSRMFRLIKSNAFKITVCHIIQSTEIAALPNSCFDSNKQIWVWTSKTHRTNCPLFATIKLELMWEMYLRICCVQLLWIFGVTLAATNQTGNFLCSKFIFIIRRLFVCLFVQSGDCISTRILRVRIMH